MHASFHFCNGTRIIQSMNIRATATIAVWKNDCFANFNYHLKFYYIHTIISTCQSFEFTSFAYNMNWFLDNSIIVWNSRINEYKIYMVRQLLFEAELHESRVRMFNLDFTQRKIAFSLLNIQSTQKKCWKSTHKLHVHEGDSLPSLGHCHPQGILYIFFPCIC